MWRFSTQDIASGAQDKLVIPSDGKIGPIKRTKRKFTNPIGCFLIMLAWAVIGFTFVVPYAIGDPDANRLTFGTDYNDDICEDGFLYPIHRSGVGVCVNKCPSGVVDGETLVDKNDPDDKSKMICMSSSHFEKYTQADENGFTDFDTLTPKMAYKYGVCNYKYRTEQLAHRCYFVDKAVANAFDYQVPSDFVVVWAQSFYSSAIMSVVFAVVGTIGFINFFLWSLQGSQTLTEFCLRLGGGHQAYKVVWMCIWITSGSSMVLGSRMFFDSVKFQQLPVNPRNFTEILALRLVGFLLWVFGTVWIFTMLRARHAVNHGVMLVIEAERALFAMGRSKTFFMSVINSGICITGMAISTFGVVNLATQSSSAKYQDSYTGAWGYKWGYENNPIAMTTSLAVLLAAFWSCQWLSDLMGLATSMSISRWFFSRPEKREKEDTMHLWVDFFTALHVHSGTVAIASLMHTFTEGPHRFLSTLERESVRMVRGSATERSCGSVLVTCMDWLALPFIENLIKYTSSSAYTSVAMFGRGYWDSCRTSFYLIVRNRERLGSTMCVSQVIATIGKTTAMMMTTTVFYFIQIWGFPDDTPISMTASSLICAITSWIMSSQFLAPLSQAPSTLLQCYMIDSEYFADKLSERYAEKEMHAWVDTYGGEYDSLTDSSL